MLAEIKEIANDEIAEIAQKQEVIDACKAIDDAQAALEWSDKRSTREEDRLYFSKDMLEGMLLRPIHAGTYDDGAAAAIKGYTSQVRKDVNVVRPPKRPNRWDEPLHFHSEHLEEDEPVHKKPRPDGGPAMLVYEMRVAIESLDPSLNSLFSKRNEELFVSERDGGWKDTSELCGYFYAELADLFGSDMEETIKLGLEAGDPMLTRKFRAAISAVKNMANCLAAFAKDILGEVWEGEYGPLWHDLEQSQLLAGMAIDALCDHIGLSYRSVRRSYQAFNFRCELKGKFEPHPIQKFILSDGTSRINAVCNRELHELGFNDLQIHGPSSEVAALDPAKKCAFLKTKLICYLRIQENNCAKPSIHDIVNEMRRLGFCGSGNRKIAIEVVKEIVVVVTNDGNAPSVALKDAFKLGAEDA